MKILKDKYKRQIIGVDRWENSSQYGSHKDCWGALNYVTAMGKTFTTIIAINRLFEEFPNATVQVIVPGDDLVKQWKGELRSLLKRKRKYSDVEVNTVQYLQTNKTHINSTLIVIDECHEFLSEERIKFVNGTYNHSPKLLLLTATWEDMHGRHKKLDLICPRVDVIGEGEALEKGWISKFMEYNLACNLTEKEKESYDAHTKQISKLLPKFGKGGLWIVSRCLQGGKDKDGNFFKPYAYATAVAYQHGWRKDLDLSHEQGFHIDDLWNPKKIIGYAKELMKVIRQRQFVLYEAVEKLDKAVGVIEKFDTLKTISFSQSTLFADKLAKKLNESNPDCCVVYHSNLETQMLPSDKTGNLIKHGSKRLKDRAVRRIKTGESRIISTASALDKGFDVKDIRLGIISSGTKNPTKQQQRGGRVKRLEDNYDPDTIVLIINLYIPNSAEEDSLIKRQSKSKHVIHWVDDIDEINYIPRKNKTTIKI